MSEKILVVDDDVDTLRLVGLMLERQGFEITAASNGRQALDLAKSEKPDLILLDLMMPDIDGLDVARQLRSDPQTKDILIMMFTAKTKVEDKLEGFDVGADDYLTKPTQPRELVAHVKAVLKRKGISQVVEPTISSKQGYMVGILAVKGGLGVSTLALNLGVVLGETYSKDVVVADFRPGCGWMGLELGYSLSQGLNRLLAVDPSMITQKTVDGELVSHSPNLRFLLSSPHPRDASYANAVDHFDAIAQALSYVASYIILDLEPSLTPVNEKVLHYCDRIIVVVEPVSHTIAQTRSFVEALSEQGINSARLAFVLVNKVRSGIQLTSIQVKEQLGYDLVNIFTPAIDLAYQSSTNNEPMVIRKPDGIIAQQFASLAEFIV